MIKKTLGRRFLSLVLALVFTMSLAVPSSAMGFDDLQTVVDMTGSTSEEVGGETSLPDFVEPDEEVSPDKEEGNNNTSSETEENLDQEEIPPEDETPSEGDFNEGNFDDEVVTDEETSSAENAALEDELTVDSSEEGENGWLIPDDYVLTIGENNSGSQLMTRAAGEQTNIYHTTDWSLTHRYPFGSGTSTVPAYIFTTADGRVAYCIEPAKFNSIYGHIVTGQLQYDKLSMDKQLEIARAISANTFGASNHRMYLATQAIIWEITAGQGYRSGSIYNDVIGANGLSSEYESILSAMKNMTGEIPSFMGPDKENAPLHQLEENNGEWSVTLENTNSSITMKEEDFSSKGPFTFSVSGDTLTVTSPTEADPDSFVQWSGGDGTSGLIFWVNDQNIQDKATWDAEAIPGIGYMKFHQDATPPTDTPDESEGLVGYLEITKYDGTTNLPLGGAVFRVESENFIDEAFSVPYGGAVIVIPIPEGKTQVDVTVTEVTAPDGYQLDSTPQTVTVTAGEQVNVAKLSFVDYPEPCSLTIYKYEKGNYGKALAGAKFRIRYADPDVSAEVWEMTTGADGKITIDPLPAAGTLVIEELEAPEGGYEIGEVSTQYVTVQKGEDKQVDVSNDKRPQLIVWKKDAVSGQLLQGATFQATAISSGISKTATTGPDGKAVFDDLLPNEEYRIEEIDPPPYFLPSSKVETVVIPDGSYKTIELTWENEPYSGLTIRKVSATDGRGLKGAVFGLYKGTEANPLDFLGEFQTDDNGRIVID
mgnify:FL=1